MMMMMIIIENILTKKITITKFGNCAYFYHCGLDFFFISKTLMWDYELVVEFSGLLLQLSVISNLAKL